MLFLLSVLEPDGELDEPVPVGTLVTVPAPAEPACDSGALQEEEVEPVCVLALPLKSQAVLALSWDW